MRGPPLQRNENAQNNEYRSAIKNVKIKKNRSRPENSRAPTPPSAERASLATTSSSTLLSADGGTRCSRTPPKKIPDQNCIFCRLMSGAPRDPHPPLHGIVLPPKNHYAFRGPRYCSAHERFNSAGRINTAKSSCESAIFPLSARFLPTPSPPPARGVQPPYFIDFIINTAIKPAMFSVFCVYITASLSGVATATGVRFLSTLQDD